MPVKDWLLLKDRCHYIPHLIQCIVTLGLVLCPEPSYLRNDSFVSSKVLWKGKDEKNIYLDAFQQKIE